MPRRHEAAPPRRHRPARRRRRRRRRERWRRDRGRLRRGRGQARGPRWPALSCSSLSRIPTTAGALGSARRADACPRRRHDDARSARTPPRAGHQLGDASLGNRRGRADTSTIGAAERPLLGGRHRGLASIDQRRGPPRVNASRPTTRRRPRSTLAAARWPSRHPERCAGAAALAVITEPNDRASELTHPSRSGEHVGKGRRRSGARRQRSPGDAAAWARASASCSATRVAKPNRNDRRHRCVAAGVRDRNARHLARRLDVQRRVQHLGDVEVGLVSGDHRRRARRASLEHDLAVVMTGNGIEEGEAGTDVGAASKVRSGAVRVFRAPGPRGPARDRCDARRSAGPPWPRTPRPRWRCRCPRPWRAACGSCRAAPRSWLPWRSAARRRGAGDRNARRTSRSAPPSPALRHRRRSSPLARTRSRAVGWVAGRVAHPTSSSSNRRRRADGRAPRRRSTRRR